MSQGTTTASHDKPALVRSLIGDGLDQSRWSLAWQGNATPWDSGGHPQPSLVGFMTQTESGKALLATSRAHSRVLVPGCGTGYDVAFFAHDVGFGEVQGVDIAPEAVRAAQNWYQSKYEGQSSEREGKVAYSVADYLAHNENEDEQKAPPLGYFDLVYDYTFFCAIPPALRPRWAQAHAKSVRSGGYLLCLVFPIHGDRQGGPPVSTSRVELSAAGCVTRWTD